MSWFLARVSRDIDEIVRRFDGYHPTIERVTKPARKKKPVVSRYPVFPRTVILPVSRYHDAMAMPTVQGSVRMNGQVLLLREADMARLREIEDENRVTLDDVLPAGERPIFNPGDRVRVITGCFLGLIGTVDTEADSCSYRVSIPGCNFPVIIDSCILANVGIYEGTKE